LSFAEFAGRKFRHHALPQKASSTNPTARVPGLARSHPPARVGPLIHLLKNAAQSSRKHLPAALISRRADRRPNNLKTDLLLQILNLAGKGRLSE